MWQSLTRAVHIYHRNHVFFENMCLPSYGTNTDNVYEVYAYRSIHARLQRVNLIIILFCLIICIMHI